ncbi:Ig-like domain-containing protein [Marinobacter sp.]|uniref:Ig-like domain-containing protein n=1 Tax=Marinobacter sp. TaxID=50741 RepID=UPI0019C3C399|nr:Ig-like domain-containing protein [Marinobacter sp.]MBC7193074.1 Ig-like domain-containing protein [Marinobacter sp.]
MSGKILARASAISLALILAACGGDENSTCLGGACPEEGGGNGGQTEATQSVDSIQLLASTPSIGTAGRDEATITALVRDENGVLLPEVGLQFSASNNGSLNVQSPTTSESGEATAVLTANNDPRNRTITVSAAAGSASGSVNVGVTGTTLSMSGPSAISSGGNATFTVRLTDSASEGISSIPITIESANGNELSGNTTTDSSGQIQFTLNAQSSGQDTISASAYEGDSRVSSEITVNISSDNFTFNDIADDAVEIGDTQTVSVTWSRGGAPVVGESVEFATTRGALSSNSDTTDNQGVASVDISSSDVGVAEITASAEGQDNEFIEAIQTIEFVSSKPYSVNLRASKKQLTTNDQADIIATVRDVNGNLVKNARVTFNNTNDTTGGTVSPGTVRTDSQGRATATYSSTDAISENDGVEITATITRQDGTQVNQSINLTVAGRALTLILGTGNTIEEPNLTTYDMPWSVIVTDANGNASTNQPVQISALPIEFYKGTYSYNGTLWTPRPYTETCQTNHADELNGTEIANPASAPRSVTTDEFGSVEFTIRYPQGECNWVRMKLTATSNVEGFSSSNTREFILPCLADDVTDEEVSPPGGSTSPYQAQACN